MTLPLESSGKKSDLEFVLLGGKVLSQEWMTHFVNVYKHHYLVLICCFWKINSASKPHFYDFFPEMMIVNKKKMHTFRNLYATSDISFSKKDFWKIIFFLRCVMRYSSSFLRFGDRPSDFRTSVKSCGSWNGARPETSGDGRRLLDTTLICGFESAYDEAEAVHSCEDSFKERTHRCIFPGGCNNDFRYWILFSTDYFSSSIGGGQVQDQNNFPDLWD